MTKSRMEAARLADAMRLARDPNNLHPDVILSDTVKADPASLPADTPPVPLVRYVPLINMGGDYCGFAPASEYPEGFEGSGTRTRYSPDGEWYRAEDVDALFAKLMKDDTPAPSDGLSEAVTKFLKAYDDLGSRGYTRNLAHRIANLRAAIAQKDDGDDE